MSETFDIVIIGAGPGGYTAAIKAAQLGLHVALIERREVGGTCLNRGCIPTKALIHTAELYREMRDSEKLGIKAESLGFDMEKIFARKNEVVTQLREGIELLLGSYKGKIELFNGSAVIVAPDTVAVQTGEGEVSLKTKNILIAAGSLPSAPPIPGITLPGVFSADEMLEQAGTAYKKLVIIGGGVIGVEFASIFNALDCEVTIIEAMERILPGMDKEISQNLSMILKRRGVGIFTASTVESIEKRDGGLICRFSHKGSTQTAEAEAVLVAVGRKADVGGLFGDGMSVDFQRGIVVDENFQTSVPGIFAVGDMVSGGIQLAHAAAAQGINAVMKISDLEPTIDLSVVPSCIYTDPEIACVGLTAEQAKARGLNVKTGKYNMTALGRSVIESRDRSFAKLVFDAESEILLGAQLMCPRASDLISELSSAIANRLTIKQLGALIRPHPSFTEGIAEAVDDAEGLAIHIAPRR